TSSAIAPNASQFISISGTEKSTLNLPESDA
ncbi:MAG: hypothetical protein ACI95C_001035, partial [Pseudohongiellaceae bacterium]